MTAPVQNPKAAPKKSRVSSTPKTTSQEKPLWFDKYFGIITEEEAQQMLEVVSELRGRPVTLDD